MELIIDITEEMYNKIIEYGMIGIKSVIFDLSKAIKLGQIIKGRQMREATKEEYESVNKYVESISVETGVNFYDLIEEQTDDRRTKDIRCS